VEDYGFRALVQAVYCRAPWLPLFRGQFVNCY
jgi:hypothetical protein